MSVAMYQQTSRHRNQVCSQEIDISIYDLLKRLWILALVVL